MNAIIIQLLITNWFNAGENSRAFEVVEGKHKNLCSGGTESYQPHRTSIF